MMDFTAACMPHRAAVLRYCTRVMQSPEEGEDVTQTTLLNAWRAWDRQTLEAGNVRRWLYRIARNACVDAMRRRKPWTVPLHTCLDADRCDVAREAEMRAECARVAGALGALTPLRSRMLLLSLAGYADREVAAMLGVAMGTVKSGTYRGRRKLRAALAA